MSEIPYPNPQIPSVEKNEFDLHNFGNFKLGYECDDSGNLTFTIQTADENLSHSYSSPDLDNFEAAICKHKDILLFMTNITQKTQESTAIRVESETQLIKNREALPSFMARIITIISDIRDMFQLKLPGKTVLNLTIEHKNKGKELFQNFIRTFDKQKLRFIDSNSNRDTDITELISIMDEILQILNMLSYSIDNDLKSTHRLRDGLY